MECGDYRRHCDADRASRGARKVAAASNLHGQPMKNGYVHGYDVRESTRLQDQASSVLELLHADTRYPPGSRVLEAGCGTGAQTTTLARNSPRALITSIDVSETSLAEARQRVAAAGLDNVRFERADLFSPPYPPASFDHVFICFVLEHL